MKVGVVCRVESSGSAVEEAKCLVVGSAAEKSVCDIRGRV